MNTLTTCKPMNATYDTLDALLLEILKQEAMTYGQLLTISSVSRELRRLAEAGRVKDTLDYWRILDRRLQALQKQQKVVFNRSIRAWQASQVIE